MFKLASVALTGVLGVAGIASSMPAAANPYVRVEVVAPGVVLEPAVYPAGPVVYARYGYGPYGHYWHRDYWHYRYDRWHHRW